jgi:prevent-host-death family protein
MGKFLPMKKISMPIGRARSELCDVVKKVQAGARVTLTSHGHPAAMIVPLEKRGKPWRVEKPDDPSHYGDLQSPVMEEWQ